MRIIQKSVLLSLLLAIMLTAFSCWHDRPPGQEEPEPQKKAQISPPIVNPPLYECATAVSVQGFIPGATINIFANGSILIGGGTSDAPWGQSFGVSPDLVDGDKITATQTYGGVTSQHSEQVEVVNYFQTHPDGLTKPKQDTPLYNCGGAMGVRNLVEGGRLEVYADGNLVGSANGCGAGQWLFINPNFVIGQKVFSVESLCNISGPKSDEATVQVEPSTLPALTVGEVYENGKFVNVYNITNGALVTVYNGSQQVAGHHCAGGGQVFRLNPQPLVGDVLTAVQQLCNTTSDPSDKVEVQPCSELPAPVVQPICVDDNYITVSGTAPDARIRIYANGNLIADGGGNHIVPFTTLVVGWSITATQALGTCVSPSSTPVMVKADAAPAYNPSAWNHPDWVKCNNCYNYGCDIRTDNYAQPGHASTGTASKINCKEVGSAAEDDGLTNAGDNTCVGCTHKVALVIDPDKSNYDYHWYRLDDNGYWSHKPAIFPATNLDASDKPITNPETADRYYNGPDYFHNYSIFCGYYCVNKDNVIISGSRSCNK